MTRLLILSIVLGLISAFIQACYTTVPPDSQNDANVVKAFATPRPGEIVPGVGIDSLQLGNSSEQIKRRLGPPHEEYEFSFNPPCTRTEIHWILKNTDHAGIFAYLRNDKVFQIQIDSDEYFTPDGIGSGTSASVVLAKLPNQVKALLAKGTGDKINGGRDLVYLIDEPNGIAYEMYFDSRIGARRVANIIIFPSGTEMIPTGCQPEWQKMISIDVREVLSR